MLPAFQKVDVEPLVLISPSYDLHDLYFSKHIVNKHNDETVTSQQPIDILSSVIYPASSMTSPTTTTESSPLIPPAPIRPQALSPKIQKNVTFNPETSIAPQVRPLATARSQPANNVAISNPPQHASQPILSALNGKLRRRNSHSSPFANPPLTPTSVPKLGAQRTTKTAQKLKLLPNPDPGEDGPDEESGRDVYSQFTRIKDPTARRDAARLGKADRQRLPRVTGYCTANAYRLDGLMKFLKSRGKTRGAKPKQFDECIYSPFDYGRAKPTRLFEGGFPQNDMNTPVLRERRKSDSAVQFDTSTNSKREKLIDFTSDAGDITIQTGESSIADGQIDYAGPVNPDFDTEVHTPEVFLFEYGAVVIWGMTLLQEQRFLKDIANFETEKLNKEDIQVEDFNFYYTREYQARIYNDFISLREKRNYMTKLAISHAVAQSVKVSGVKVPSTQFRLTRIDRAL